MNFAIRTESASRVHLSAYGGSDKSGGVRPAVSGAWRVYTAAGIQIDYFTQAMLMGGPSSNMLRETNLDGLVPGASYIIELTSQDYCANQASVRQSLTMPVASSETEIPVLSTPTLVQIGGWGVSLRMLSFAVTDNSGIRDIEVSINGVKTHELHYGDGVHVRWWADEYPDDGVKSTLEGPFYYLSYPDSFKGVTGLVEVVAVDLYGNRSLTSVVLRF